jgi:MFS family permease
VSDDTARRSAEHRAKTLLRSGRALPPRLLYIGMQSLDALLLSIAYTIYGLYAVKVATLSLLELTLVGTIMELAIFLTEVPAGMVADIYSRPLSVTLGLCLISTGIALIGAVPTFWCIALGSMLWGVGGTFISGAHQAWLADEITFLYGMSSEALNRLAPVHLLDTIGLPSRFAQATWFGVLHAGSLPGGGQGHVGLDPRHA